MRSRSSKNLESEPSSLICYCSVPLSLSAYSRLSGQESCIGATAKRQSGRALLGNGTRVAATEAKCAARKAQRNSLISSWNRWWPATRLYQSFPYTLERGGRPCDGQRRGAHNIHLPKPDEDYYRNIEAKSPHPPVRYRGVLSRLYSTSMGPFCCLSSQGKKQHFA